jgi:hypothetical protein
MYAVFQFFYLLSVVEIIPERMKMKMSKAATPATRTVNFYFGFISCTASFLAAPAVGFCKDFLEPKILNLKQFFRSEYAVF